MGKSIIEKNLISGRMPDLAVVFCRASALKNGFLRHGRRIRMRKETGKFNKRGVQILAVGLLTGFFVGVIVSFFNLAAEFAVKKATTVYALVRENPAWIPLFFLALIAISVVVATISELVPMARGSGIPQTEGAARGLIELKWYRSLPAMAAACLLSMFSGLTAGGEGPSMFIGSACGEGTSKLLGCTDMERRYQLTGGACAGLAVAFNAPLTGIVFAFEEAHRRFTPAIFICAFSAVLSAIVTRNVLFGAIGMEITSEFTSFRFLSLPVTSYGYVVLAALCCGVLGFASYRLCLFAKRVFAKITFARKLGKMTIPFVVAGVFGLLCPSVIGGGHGFIESLGTLGGTVSSSVSSVFALPVIASLCLILVMRVIATALNLGAGVPCGVFIPMLAIGAGLGALLARLCVMIGLDPVYGDLLVMICMATFFTSVVKAPITAILMTVELTWNFTLLVPVILGVSLGYMIGETFGTKPIYEVLLEGFLEEQQVKLQKYTYVTTIEKGSIAADVSIRDVLWPGSLLVRSIRRGEENIVAASDTVLRAGDELTIQAEVVDFERFRGWVDEIVKPRRRIFRRKGKGKDGNPV